jgi:hypothetical protein
MVTNNSASYNSHVAIYGLIISIAVLSAALFCGYLLISDNINRIEFSILLIAVITLSCVYNAYYDINAWLLSSCFIGGFIGRDWYQRSLFLLTALINYLLLSKVALPVLGVDAFEFTTLLISLSHLGYYYAFEHQDLRQLLRQERANNQQHSSYAYLLTQHLPNIFLTVWLANVGIILAFYLPVGYFYALLLVVSIISGFYKYDALFILITIIALINQQITSVFSIVAIYLALRNLDIYIALGLVMLILTSAILITDVGYVIPVAIIIAMIIIRIYNYNQKPKGFIFQNRKVAKVIALPHFPSLKMSDKQEVFKNP